MRNKFVPFISGSDSQRIESGDAIAEELAYVVIVRYIAFCTPACRTAIFVPAVCILEFGGTDGVTYGQVGGECNALQSGLSLLVVIRMTPLAACEP